MDMQLVFLLWALLVLSGLCASREAGLGARSPYPFLYFGQGEIPRMRRQARTTHDHIARQIRQAVREISHHPNKYHPPKDWDRFASRWNEHYGNNLCVLAMHAVLYEWEPTGRRLAFQFMDVLASLKNWRVKASLTDDVPVAHSLHGMATAYDFLYPYMSSKQRQRYLEKIVTVTREIYEGSKRNWWGRHYIQNHVLTNYAALLTGALVASRQKQYSEEATKWITKAKLMLSRNMYLLNFVVDGSLEEGVPYGTYTSRSVTQFIYLALRHWKMDLTKSTWLKRHFEFLYYTILPGFQETVGIADSNRNWFYGPESQLVFLESFVLRNGWGNWLADQIRRQRTGFTGQAKSMVNCMLHTEFVFYNASIEPRAPPDFKAPHLHAFTDWGVVIYRDRMSEWTTRRNWSYAVNGPGTFLSFKCSVLHGRAVNSMVVSRAPVPWVKGWRNFNPGHEHLDQGSFVFAPNGVPFITEALYGPKYTWLNNAILFGPSFASPCSQPIEGQIGECLKWFDYKSLRPWKAQGEVTTAAAEGGLVLACGEMATWYRVGLGLASVYRCLVLLSPSVLLVVDHVERKEYSKMTHISAFFHNTINPFKQDECEGVDACAEITLEGRKYRVLSVNSLRHQSELLFGVLNYSTQFQKRQTNFVNITTPLNGKYTRAVYLFMGPGHKLDALRISGQDHGVHVTITLDHTKYTVAIATKHSLPYARFSWLGFGGYGKVKLQSTKGAAMKVNQVVRFGMDSVNDSSPIDRKTHRAAPSGHSVLLLALPVSGVLCALLFLYSQLLRLVAIRAKWRRLFNCILIVWVVLAVLGLLRVCTSWYTCTWEQSKQTVMGSVKSGSRRARSGAPPFVVYTSLPWAGAELLGEVYKSDRDFYSFSLLHEDFNNVTMNNTNAPYFAPKELLDPCALYRYSMSSGESHYISEWFNKFKRNQRIFHPNLPKRAETSFPALHLKDPGWALRMHWLRRVLGNRMKAVLVVRDPRSWVSAWLKELKLNLGLLRRTRKSVDDLKEHHCRTEEENHFATELKAVQTIFLSVEEGQEISSYKMLAHLWATHMHAVLRLTKTVPKGHLRVVRFEDLVLRPMRTVKSIYRFMSQLVPHAVEHRMLQVTKMDKFRVGDSHEVVEPKITSNWKKALTGKQIREIDSICSLLMSQLRYKPMAST